MNIIIIIIIIIIINRRSCFITDQASLKDLFTASDLIPQLFPMIYQTILNIYQRSTSYLEHGVIIINSMPGVKLPKTENDWNNDYFKLYLYYNSEITDISLTIRTFN